MRLLSLTTLKPFCCVAYLYASEVAVTSSRRTDSEEMKRVSKRSYYYFEIYGVYLFKNSISYVDVGAPRDKIVPKKCYHGQPEGHWQPMH